MGSFRRKSRSEETVNPAYFHTRFDEEWRVVKKYNRPRSMR